MFFGDNMEWERLNNLKFDEEGSNMQVQQHISVDKSIVKARDRNR